MKAANKCIELLALGINTEQGEDDKVILYSASMPKAEVRITRNEFIDLPPAIIIGMLIVAGYDLALEEAI